MHNKMTRTRRSIFLSACVLVAQCEAWYLPGTTPTDYSIGETIPLLVNPVSPLSDADKIHSVLSYDYYTSQFHFCQPEGSPKAQAESLGSILFGDRLFNSPFEISMRRNEQCKQLCRATMSGKDAAFVNQRIKEKYAVNWLIDGLPAAKAKIDEQEKRIFYSVGFDLGNATKEETVFYNHYDILIEYHKPKKSDLSRVVGVLVWPASVDNIEGAASGDACNPSLGPLKLREDQDNEFYYTYSVQFKESPVAWATRWDTYMPIYAPRIHWLSLFNSIILALFLCGIVAVVLMRTVIKDISHFNAMDLEEDTLQEDVGWKLLHAEVFRPPQHRIYLAVAVGAGAQMVGVVSVSLLFAVLGFLSPSNRGALGTVMLVFWLLFSTVASYVSIRLYLSMGGRNWKKNVLFSATLFPAALFTFLNLINLFLWVTGSSGAVPFGTMLAIVALWFLVSVPLTGVGAYIGIRHGTISHPTNVNPIPRQIPPTPTYLRTWPAAVIAGSFGFAAGFIELFFLLNSLFGARLYYAFGFLGIVFVVVSLTTATLSVLITYCRLISENYRWHWASFIGGAGSSFWLILYGLYYWAVHLSLNGFSSRILFAGYLLMLSGVNAVLFGSISFAATYIFLRRIYRGLRID